MNIVFRVDASTIIGSGHVMRCLTLADTLKNHGHFVTFISRNLPGNLNKVIQKRNFKVVGLPFDANKARLFENKTIYERFLSEERDVEIQQSQACLDKLKPDWIVVDHYSLDTLWENAVKKDSRKIMVIDDLANRKHTCDLLLDQNYYFNSDVRYNALVPFRCRQLLGPRYALIKQEFLKIYNERKHIGKFNFDKIQKIVLFMGGADCNNMTLRVLQHMRQHSILNYYDVSVIIGLMNPNKKEIETFCFNNRVLNFIFPHNFGDFLTNADLFIGAGGSSVYERCFAGIPSIVFSLAENQQKICEDVANIGAHIFLEKIDYLSDLIGKLNHKKLKYLYRNSKKLFAGYRGSKGVVDEIQSHQCDIR